MKLHMKNVIVLLERYNVPIETTYPRSLQQDQLNNIPHGEHCKHVLHTLPSKVSDHHAIILELDPEENYKKVVQNLCIYQIPIFST